MNIPVTPTTGKLPAPTSTQTRSNSRILNVLVIAPETARLAKTAQSPRPSMADASGPLAPGQRYGGADLVADLNRGLVSSLDVHLNPSMLFQHKTYLSVGHDEYWSLEMRNGVEAARDGGVNLGFFSANTAYWRVRFEPSSSGVPNRVMVCYKDPLVGDPIAPTYLWRGPQNNRPENALLGVMYVGDNDSSGGFDYVVSNAADPYYLNTGLTNNTALSQLVGYEWDAVVNNGFTPPGLVVLSSSTVDPTSIAPGLPTGTSTTTSNAARYTASGGAKVFATGSIQFAWGLNSDGISPPRDDPRIKQFAINVLKDLGATPLTPDDGMIVP